MKKIITKSMCVLLLLITSTWRINAQTWIGFSSTNPVAPECTVISSTNQQVHFTVSIAGINVESKPTLLGTFSRISLPGCEKTGEIGAPEIPVIAKMIAVPECSEIRYTVTKYGMQTLSNYLVYPVPDHRTVMSSDGTFYVEEVFTINQAFYERNSLIPTYDYLITL